MVIYFSLLFVYHPNPAPITKGKKKRTKKKKKRGEKSN
jgi:hypothetical protein